LFCGATLGDPPHRILRPAPILSASASQSSSHSRYRKHIGPALVSNCTQPVDFCIQPGDIFALTLLHATNRWQKSLKPSDDENPIARTSLSGRAGGGSKHIGSVHRDIFGTRLRPSSAPIHGHPTRRLSIGSVQYFLLRVYKLSAVNRLRRGSSGSETPFPEGLFLADTGATPQRSRANPALKSHALRRFWLGKNSPCPFESIHLHYA